MVVPAPSGRLQCRQLGLAPPSGEAPLSSGLVGIDPSIAPPLGRQREATHNPTSSFHEFRQDHPLNLSISVGGGKETNQDSPSSGERSGNSPT